MRCIQHVTIITPDERIEDGAILLEQGRIVAAGPGTAVALPDGSGPPEGVSLLSADGLIAVPGFLDMQLNGGFGLDFTTAPETIWQVAAQLPRFGVTSFLPTIVTSPLVTVRQAQQVLHSGPPAEFMGAAPLGLHVEGPFLNPQKKGAHNPNYLRMPSVADIESWDQCIRLVTLAPELEGAHELIRVLVDRGIVVSAGHSMATYDQAVAAFDAGVSYGTHLFNAMPPLHHREPALPAALLNDERVTVGLIPDGVHVHPGLVKLIWGIAGNRINAVTDSMAAMGMPPGRYTLGDFDCTVDATTVQLDDGTLAGSIVTMDAVLRNLIAFTGCSLGEAVRSITTLPAGLLGLANKGRIKEGCDADFVLLTADLQIHSTYVAGECVYQSGREQV